MEIPNASTAPTIPASEMNSYIQANKDFNNSFNANPFNTPNDAAPSAPLTLPREERPAAPPVLTNSKPIKAPELGAFNPSAVKLTAPEYTKPKLESLDEILKSEKEVEEKVGYNPNLTAEQIKRVEGKKGELDSRKERAGGEALFNFGLGLLGAKRGQEFETAGKSGQAALSAYKNDVKELQAAQDKYDERVEALRVADNEAKRTKSAAAIAKRDRQQDKVDAAEQKVFEVNSRLVETGAQVSAITRGQDVSAATSVYTAQLSAQTQRDIARLSAETQRWVSSRPPAEILAIEEVAKRTGKPFEQAMKDFYGARAGARNMYTREEAMKDARKNLENQGIINPTDAQMQAEINKQMRIYGGDNGGGGGSLQQGANGSFNYVPRQ